VKESGFSGLSTLITKDLGVPQRVDFELFHAFQPPNCGNLTAPSNGTYSPGGRGRRSASHHPEGHQPSENLSKRGDDARFSRASPVPRFQNILNPSEFNILTTIPAPENPQNLDKHP